MDKEYLAHRKALEDGGWLQGGKIIHHWFRGDDHPVSFYIIAFMYCDKMLSIDCIRVFGGDAGTPAQVSVDKRIRNWNQIFGE